MKLSLHPRPFKQGVQILLCLLLSVALLGAHAAYASGLCVHPEGTGNCFRSIQAAVDAADDGDQIVIRPGKYIEQVTIIGKDLTLAGQRGAVIQAPVGMQDTLTPLVGQEARPIILVAGGEVTIRDLVIDGANSAANNPFLNGIYFINAGGVIRDNVVKNIGFGAPALPVDEQGWPLYQGEAIVAVSFGETPQSLSIEGNQVLNFNSAGITIFAETPPDASTPASMSVQVTDNTIIGSGPNDVLGQWGIFFGGYNGAGITGALRGNRIRDLITIDQYPAPGTGIATKDTSALEISGNTLENMNMGLTISGMGTQILENRFKKIDTGILLFVDFPGYGNALGTMLQNNRFEHMSLDLMTGPVMMFETMAKAGAAPVRAGRLPR